MVMEKRLWEELQRIVSLVNSTEILRMGKIFSTEKNNYFYDTGTGKVIELDDESYYVFYNWFHQTDIVTENFVNDLGVNEKNLSELLKLCISENLLRAIKPVKLYTPNPDKPEKFCITSRFQVQ